MFFLPNHFDLKSIIKLFSKSFLYSDGRDFTQQNQSITFNEEGVQCVKVTIKNDSLLEVDEQIIAVLRTQDSDVILGYSSAPITIIDSDSKYNDYSV